MVAWGARRDLCAIAEDQRPRSRNPWRGFHIAEPGGGSRLDRGFGYGRVRRPEPGASSPRRDLAYLVDCVYRRDLSVLAETRPDSRCWLFDPCGTCHPFSSSHQFLLCERERVKKGLHRGLAEAPAAVIGRCSL